jgi:hypothetical protein
LEEEESGMTLEEGKDCEKYGSSPKDFLDCYDNVKQGLHILYDLVPDEDILISRAAIYILAWFPEKAFDSINQINNQIKFLKNEKDIQ